MQRLEVRVVRLQRVQTVYNDLGLCNTSDISLTIQWHQLIAHKACVFLPCLIRHPYCT